MDDEKKALAKALDDAELEVLDATRAVRRGRMRCKRTKQKRIKLLAMGKLKERLRNQPFDQQQEVVTAADDLEGYGEQVQEWDDYDETEDRAFSSGKKKKKSKKKNKHLYGDFD